MMKVINTISEITSYLSTFKSNGKKIGFVPTMGALHFGHLSIVKTSKENNDITVVSIFVNPTQFNDKQDFIKYAREPEEDLNKLIETDCDLVFMPSEKEMYPENVNTKFELGYIESIMEGEYRPGHFQGVALIVDKLFSIIKPDNAYFGQKDFQQLAIIKQLVKITNSTVNIISCPIVRETNGLAMSSRNKRLSTKEFEEAAIIYSTLKQIGGFINDNKLNEFKIWAAKQINSNNLFKIEYIEIVDSESLKIVTSLKNHKSITCCIAVFCGEVRLIDNIQINL